ncbi:metalloprotease [Candidatus Woesearchaeota archaeon]|nr:MAG: metalloprotease [Candidatus Woesearchaeota archaeon]
MKKLYQNFKISKIESGHLLKAWIAISIAFALVLRDGETSFISLVFLSGLTVGVGFLFHELAHKLVAQKYNCWAEFRADNSMLIMMLLMSFVGFLFAAPGAVMIHGNITKKRNGIISLAGPATNFILAILFILLIFTPLAPIGVFGAYINSFLGLFNMIPFLNFDGKKILAWNKPIYISTLVTGVVLLIISIKL